MPAGRAMTMLWDLAGRLLPLLGLALAALTILATLGFFSVVHPTRYLSSRTPADLGWQFERVALRTGDGLTLSGWYIPRAGGPAGQRALIVLHGYPFDKGNILGVTPFLHEEYDLLLFDFRYFGESEGALTSVGHRERQDVLAAVDHLHARGIRSIGLWGLSMGGATALLVLPHTALVHAVVADSAYSDLGAMTLDYYRFLPLANRVLAAHTDLLTRLTFGVSLGEISPVRAVERTQVPILLIHGADDRTIPVDHFERLRDALAANAAAEFWLLERAGHGLTYAGEPDAYESRVLAFFARHLG